MNERPTTIDIPTEISARRAEIINSILRDGLKSSEQLQKEGKPFFGSFDQAPNNFISFRLMFPPDIYKAFPNSQHTLEGTLYEGSVSILPIITERQNHRSSPANLPLNLAYSISDSSWSKEEEKKSVKQVLESRISSSFLIVINETMEELIAKSKRFLFTSAKERFEKLENICRLRESRISSDRFSYLLFPKSVWDQYKNGQTNTNNLQIKIVEKNIERNLFNGHMSLLVPDYESALSEILEERKEPLWVHGVRLPNKEDLSPSPTS